MADMLDTLVTGTSDAALLKNLSNAVEDILTDLETFNYIRRRFLRLERVQRGRQGVGKAGPLMTRLESRMAAELPRGGESMRAVIARLTAFADAISSETSWIEAEDNWLRILWKADSPYAEKLEAMFMRWGFSKEEIAWMRTDMAKGEYRLCGTLFPRGAADVRVLLHAVSDGENSPDQGGFLRLPEDPQKAEQVRELIIRARNGHLTASVYAVVMVYVALCLAQAEHQQKTDRGEVSTGGTWLDVWNHA